MRTHRSREGRALLKLHVEQREAQNLSQSKSPNGRERKHLERINQTVNRSRT